MQFDSRSLKIGNCFDFHACRWRTTYRWKSIDDGYNFSLDFIAIGGLHAKLWAPKVARIQTVGIPRFPLGIPGTKCHLDVGFVERHKVYFKGEDGGFPQVWAVVNLVNPNLFVIHLSTKSLQIMHYQLVVWFVSHETCSDSLLFRCFHFRLTFEFSKGFGSASLNLYYFKE